MKSLAQGLALSKHWVLTLKELLPHGCLECITSCGESEVYGLMSLDIIESVMSLGSLVFLQQGWGEWNEGSCPPVLGVAEIDGEDAWEILVWVQLIVLKNRAGLTAEENYYSLIFPPSLLLWFSLLWVLSGGLAVVRVNKLWLENEFFLLGLPNDWSVCVCVYIFFFFWGWSQMLLLLILKCH